MSFEKGLLLEIAVDNSATTPVILQSHSKKKKNNASKATDSLDLLD
jgi:hypothetical protein